MLSSVQLRMGGRETRTCISYDELVKGLMQGVLFHQIGPGWFEMLSLA